MKNLRLTSFILFLCFSLSAQTDSSDDEFLNTNTSVENEKAEFKTRMSNGDYNHLGQVGMPGQQLVPISVASAFSNRRLTYDEIKGSPYLNPKPVNGIIVLNDGKEITKIPLKIDIYNQTVVATNPEGKDIALNPREYNSIIIPYNNQILTLQKVHSEKPEIFVAVLYKDDDLVFFREDYATFRDATRNGISDTDASFFSRQNYYIHHRKNKIPTKVKLKEKYIIKALPKRKADALLRYTKKNKLKLQTESDIINALRASKSSTPRKS